MGKPHYRISAGEHMLCADEQRCRRYFDLALVGTATTSPEVEQRLAATPVESLESLSRAPEESASSDDERAHSANASK